MKSKSILSMLLVMLFCVSLLCSQVSATSSEVFVKPNWFDATSDSNWYNWDWQHGAAGNRFSITHGINSTWTCTVNYDWALDVTNPDGICSVDTQIYPIMKFAYDFAIPVAIELIPVTYQGNTNVQNTGIPIGSLQSGAGNFEIDLRDISNLLPSSTNSIIQLKGIRFVPTTSGSFTICNLRFTVVDAEPLTSPDWFEAENDQNWYNWDWKYGDDGNRFSLTHGQDGSWNCTINYDWALDITNPGNKLFVANLQEKPFVNFTYQTTIAFSVELIPLLTENGFNTNNQGVIIGSLAVGSGSFSVDLNDIEELSKYKRYNQLRVKGIRLTPTSAGQISINNFDFSAMAILPEWFDSSKDTNWLHYDWQYGNDGDRFLLTHDQDGTWNCTVNYDWVDHALCIDNVFTIDVLNNPAITFDYSADMSFTVKLIPSVYNNLPNTENQSVILGSASAGDGTFSIDVNTITALSAYLINGKLNIKGIRFDFANKGTLKINSFRLQKNITRINVTYYLDSISGNDNNDGMSPQTAWKTLQKANSVVYQPGTRLLLKSGSIFNGTLQPNATGRSGELFVIDRYGEGNKPVINGNGEANAIHLDNIEYVEVRNLEITNLSSEKALRRAVSVISGGSTTSGELRPGGYIHHVYLINLDINGVNTWTDRWRGGIVFLSEAASTPSAFEDVLVEGCTVQYSEANGLSFTSVYTDRDGINWGGGAYFPSNNIKIRNNFIGNSAGDGIYVTCANDPIIEYNTVWNTGYDTHTPYAGIWPHNSSNAVIQYNEALAQKFGYGDGQGFDVDINCSNSLVQYNYSHDNEGGFLLLCTDGANNGFNTDITVRYNISQNDGTISNTGQVFTLSGPINNVKIYNNTVYIAENLPVRLVGAYEWGQGKIPTNVNFSNNIFYNLGTGTYTLPSQSSITFTNNVFYGNHPSSEPYDAYKITSDPRFINPNSGTNGIDTVSGYRLRCTSPCIQSGVAILNNGGQDYFGTLLSENQLPDIGAIRYVE